MTEHILIAGKGGVGKSTTAANLAAALSESGNRVTMIGYDPRRNSTVTLRGGSKLLPVSNGPAAPLFTVGYKDSLCVEVGELNKEMNSPWFSSQLNPLISGHNPHYIIHDLWYHDEKPFLLPPVTEEIPRLLVVSSGEMGSVQVLNELFQWLNNISSSDCRFSGVIVNNTKNKVYELIINDFVSRTGTSVVGSFPHSLMVSLSDYLGQTLLEAAPYSHNSILYRKLAQQIINSEFASRPTFFDETELEHWSIKWCEVISRMESGVVMDGSGI